METVQKVYLITPKNRSLSRLTVLLLIFISVIGLFMRVAYNRKSVIKRPFIADARDYAVYGYNLIRHQTFSKEFPSDAPCPDSLRSPGYPLLVAWSFFLGGDRGFYRVAILTQILIGTLLVPLTFFLGIRMLPLWGAFTACFLVAFSPHLISMTSYMLAETLMSFVLTASIFSFYHAVKQGRHLWFAMAGFGFGLVYLTNEAALFIPYFFVFAVLLISRFSAGKNSDTNLLLSAVLFLLIFSLFPIGWMLRNHIVPAPDAPKGKNRMIATMTHGTYPGFIYKSSKYKNFPYREDPMQPEFSASFSNFGRIFRERFKQRPLRYLCWYLLEKPYYLWSWDNLQSQMGTEKRPGCGDVYFYPVITSLYQTSKAADLTRKIMKYLHPLILVLALAGIPICYSRYRRKKIEEPIANMPIFLFIPVCYFSLLYMVFAPWPRYSVPLRPVLYLCAMWTLNVGYKFITDRFG
ncbi:MAG: glycosyltransferase family 39 protein [Proteobacteria bacterium]|nr:glycosyltransferase family 39 protein [Pseudomonadota bacterium]